MLNGENYLISRNKVTNEIIRIALDTNWYQKDNFHNKIFGCSLAFIDNMTTKFRSEKEFIERLYNNGYIDSENVDLYIAHLHKFNGRSYITKHEIIYNNKERVKIIKDLSKDKIEYNTITGKSLVDLLMNKLITKNHYDIVFHDIMTCPWSKVDGYVSEQLIKEQKSSKVNYEIKYRLSDKFNDYLVIRNIIYMWNLYDDLILANKDVVINGTIKELSVKITNDYIRMLEEKQQRNDCDSELVNLTNKSYIEGQMSLEDFLKNDTKKYTL